MPGRIHLFFHRLLFLAAGALAGQIKLGIGGVDGGVHLGKFCIDFVAGDGHQRLVFGDVIAFFYQHLLDAPRNFRGHVDFRCIHKPRKYDGFIRPGTGGCQYQARKQAQRKNVPTGSGK